MSSARRLLLTFAAPTGLLAAAAVTVWISASTSDRGFGPMLRVPMAARQPSGALPDAPPLNVAEKLSPIQAELRNALIPYTSGGLLSPAQYSPAGQTGEDAASALTCLTSAIYYEAGREPLVGQQAVAQVIVNRRASAAFPKTICGVVQQGAPRPGCQFTFECDGSLDRRPDPATWASARVIAEAALNGFTLNLVGTATHYHADYVVPVWATTMIKLVKVGHHIFYRWPGARLAPVPALAPPPVGASDPGTPAAPPVQVAPAVGLKPMLAEAPAEAARPPSAQLSNTTEAPGPPPALTSGPPASSTATHALPAPTRRAIPEQSLRGGGPF